MIDILQITTTDAVRGVLGADGLEELTDAQLISINLPFELEVDLDEWLEPLKAVADIISEGTAPGATLEQKMTYRTLQLYGKYFCAYRVANSAEYTLLEVLNDGQSEVRRTKRDLPAFLARLAGLAGGYKAKLIEGAGGEVSTTPSFFSRVAPSLDPVTNETL